MQVANDYIDLLINVLTDNIYKLDNISEPRRLAGGGAPNYTCAHTMTGLVRMYNTKELINNIAKNGIEGDFVETGVWRGGQVILMNGMNKAYGLNRKVYAFDSFEGLPPPNRSYKADEGDEHYKLNDLKVGVDIVKENFRRYNLLDDNVTFVKGYFETTMKNVDYIDKISLLRLDGDMYSSTIVVLNALYDKVVPGGYVVVDDWTLPGANKAVLDFLNSRNITPNFVPIHSRELMQKVNSKEPYSVYFQKN